MRRFGLGVLLLAVHLLVPVRAAEIALIIDDMGNSIHDAAAFDLPVAVTFSILPFTPLSQQFSHTAEQQSREVMLHVPMEALNGKALGPGAITSDMLPTNIQDTLQAALNNVPNAVGLNNHMGSKLTQLTLPMQSTMHFLQHSGLYFIDSRTTRYSKAERIARQNGVPVAHRHVFLDHVADEKHIDGQFKRLLQLARKQGIAVAIGHPYPKTLAYLQTHLQDLQQQGIRLVPVSELVLPNQSLWAALSEPKTSPPSQTAEELQE